MDTGPLIGLIGGVVGSAIGVTGGIIGTYYSIKNTKGPKERAFMQKASIVCWVAIGLFLGLMVLLPTPYRFLLWIPYGILLPLGIIFSNRTQQRIRKEEAPKQETQGVK